MSEKMTKRSCQYWYHSNKQYWQHIKWTNSLSLIGCHGNKVKFKLILHIHHKKVKQLAEILYEKKCSNRNLNIFSAVIYAKKSYPTDKGFYEKQ